MNDMFKNEDEEDSYENNKYIMSNNEEKDIKIETTTNENEIKSELLNHEINTEETNQIIPAMQYKSNSENQNNNNNIDENLISNDFEEAKMSIKNFLKNKISSQYNKTENNEKEENNILNENNNKNNTDIKNALTQVQMSNSSISKGLNNMVINSSRTSGESMGNSIDNYIKMENLYLQDGKINSTGTNYDCSNTNNNITTNNNSNHTPNMQNNTNSTKKNEKKKDKNVSKLVKNKDKNNTPKNIINVIDYDDNDNDEGENQEKENEENINTNDNINNNFNNENDNDKNYNNMDTKNNNNNTEEENNEYNLDNKLIINYNALDSEAQQKMRNDKANELRIKTINKLRPKIYEEIYKNEYDNIVMKIHREYENQLREELVQKMTEELNYIKKKENFNQKIKMQQIDNAIKEKVKNEFEEQLNKEIILKEKEIKIRYNQKYENFKKKFEKELSEEYEKKKKEMRNQLNDIKSKIYRSRCSEKIKINKINKMKKNIGVYNEKNAVGIKKIDKILGNEEPSDEEINQNNNQENNEIDNFFPPSLKLNNNNRFNQYEGNKYDTNFNYDDNNFQFTNDAKYSKNNQRNNNNNIDMFNYNNDSNYMKNNHYSKVEKNNINKNNYNTNNTNSFKRKSFGDNSVNLAELNQKIRNSTDKISSHSFISPTKNNFLKQNYFEDKDNNKDKNEIPKEQNIPNYNNDIFKNEIKYENYNDIDNKKENSFNFYNDNENNNIEHEVNPIDIIKPKAEPIIKKYNNNNNSNSFNNRNNTKYTNTNTTNNNFNFDYSNKLKIMKKNNNNFIFDKNKNIFYSLQIDNNIPTNVSDFGKYLINHIEKEDNYKNLFLTELKSFKMKIKKIFSNSRTNDHCLTDYLLDIWDKLEISYYIRYQIMNNVIKLDANNLYLFLDRETEYLTNYSQMTENIFEQIKKRENIKAKLQIKANRNEFILPGDRAEFERITKNLEENIKIFKNEYRGMNIVWKGIFYEWFMNYEKWFYEMESRNDFEYIN